MKILIAINQSRVLYDFKRELVDALAARGAEVILTLEEDFRAEYFKEELPDYPRADRSSGNESA